MQIVTMRLKADLNPNHKYKFFLLDVPTSWWVLDVGFVSHEDSLYLAPQILGTHTVSITDADGQEQSRSVSLENGFHVSIHETGTVNITAGSDRTLVRGALSTLWTGHLFTLSLRNASVLTPAPHEEVNSLPPRFTVIPVSGILALGPIFISAFRFPRADPVPLTPLGDTIQLNAECPIRGKKMKYLFSIWQHKNARMADGDLTMSLNMPPMLAA